MSQTIKSLKQQMSKIDVDGFTPTDYKRGDYGYNLVYGTVDGDVEAAFRIPYQKDGDEAIPKITDELKYNVGIVRGIRDKLAPKDCRIIKYIDGENTVCFTIGIEVAGIGAEITLPWMVLRDNTHKLETLTPQAVFADISRILAAYTKNLKLIASTDGFTPIKCTQADGERKKGRHYTVPRTVVTGTAYGVTDSFCIDDLEKDNVKKILKRELKRFKAMSGGAAKKQKSGGVTDLRDRADIVDAVQTEKKLDNAYRNAYYAYVDAREKAGCGVCEKYNRIDDVVTYSFMGDRSAVKRFGGCGACEHAQAASDKLDKLLKKKQAHDEFFKSTLFPVALRFFEQTDASFYDWLINEKISWRELFSSENPDSDSCFTIARLFESGSNGQYVWADNVVPLCGKDIKAERKELLALGQSVEHNLNNAYISIRDDDLTVNDDGKIVYNTSNGEIGSNSYSFALSMIKHYGVERLEHNYALFKTADDKYKANAILAVYCAFLGDVKKAKRYKQAAQDQYGKIKTRDEKLEKLLAAV